MALHAFAASGAMPVRAAGAGFVAELCSSHGFAATNTLPGSASPGSADPLLHYCCQLCAGGSPLLLADMAIGVPPAPTFTGLATDARRVPPRSAAWRHHPPRGPPPTV